MKKISVIIPCYNVEKYIDRCIKSLEAQTIGMDAMEIILIDDASTDSTPERLKEWEKKYEDSILLVLCEENGRQGRARNIGMQYASAEFITFIDADDWIEKEMLQDMFDIIKNRPELNFVAARSELDLGDGNFCNIPFQKESETLYFHRESDEELIQKNWGGGVWAKLYRKSFLQSTHLYFPEQLTYEDNYWGTILGYYVTAYAVLPGRYYHYFINNDSTIRQNDSVHHFDRLAIAIMTDDELKKRGLDKKHPLEVELSFLRFYYINSLHTFFARFSNLPYDTLSEMQKEVRQRYPNYMDQKVQSRLNGYEQTVLRTLKSSYSKKGWDEIADVYRELYIN